MHQQTVTQHIRQKNIRQISGQQTNNFSRDHCAHQTVSLTVDNGALTRKTKGTFANSGLAEIAGSVVY